MVDLPCVFLCRNDCCLDGLLRLCGTPDQVLQLAVVRALEQVMVASNRQYIARHHLFDSVVSVACSRGTLESVQCGSGLLENLFKESTGTCMRLVNSGALEGIIYGCRYSDSLVLQHCAAALANCAMYGGPKCQGIMVAKHADHWLFPLAFSNDPVVKYYALLAVCFLAANTDIADKVADSSTLELVLPFLNTQDPQEFAKSCPNHAHGRSSGWLKRLLPLLSSESEEARSLAAFHLAMEADIKQKQQRLKVFTEIDAIDNLVTAAKQGSHLTAKLCCQALSTCQTTLPEYQCWDVLRWGRSEVAAWVCDIGLQKHAQSFSDNFVTGNLLLDMTLEDLLEIGLQSKMQCRWFLGKTKELRRLADVASRDKDHVCKWLTDISPDLSVYRVDFIRCGITKALLPNLADEILVEIGVRSNVDRLKILMAVESMADSGQDTPDQPQTNFHLTSPPSRHKYDVFVSYRRATGSQLASLLKVHMQVRGVSVFLDVSELGSGKFEAALLTHIKHCSNFVLILTPNSLDRCVGDDRLQDWVHREIVCALDHGAHVVPVIDPVFEWPQEDKLPLDVRKIKSVNGLSWTHEYQDACVEKLISFLHLPSSFNRRYSRTRSSTTFTVSPARD